MAAVRLSRRAVKDLDAISKTDARRVLRVIEQLGDDPENESLDVKALAGRRPWRRLSVGDYRMLFRVVDARTVLIARVIHRRDLERAVRTLPD